MSNGYVTDKEGVGLAEAGRIYGSLFIAAAAAENRAEASIKDAAEYDTIAFRAYAGIQTYLGTKVATASTVGPESAINAAAQHQADAAIKAAAEYRESEWRRQEQAAEPRRYGSVPASEVMHLRAEVARLTELSDLLQGMVRSSAVTIEAHEVTIATLRASLGPVAPQPASKPHPLLRAIRARPGNYGLAGLAH